MRRLRKTVLAVIGFSMAVTQLFAQVKPAELKYVGDPAPPLYIKKWLKGKEFKTLEKGHVYVVEFWATWCKPCIAGMPHLSELAAQYKGKADFIGVSIMERKTTPLNTIKTFVDGMGDKMAYNVAVEDSSLMADRWLKAFGERGIPQAFVVDQQGRIAWLGLPNQLEKVLPAIVAGTYDIEAAAAKRKEFIRLSAIDNTSVFKAMNPLMGNPGKLQEALSEIKRLVAENPGIKYYPYMGHFTFWTLVKTDPAQALSFGKEWVAANDEPKYSTITDAVTERPGLPAGLYAFAAEAYQAQLGRYPWSMDFKATYKKMADLYKQAGMNAEAEKMMAKSAAVK